MAPTQTSPHWLFVLPFVPRPDHASGDLRLVAMLGIVAGRGRVSVVSLQSRDEGDAEYIARLTATGIRFLGTGFAVAARALVLEPFHAVLFEFWFTTDRLLRLVHQLQPHALVVVDSVDVHYLREREAARLGTLAPDVPVRTQLAELAAYRAADTTIVVSSAEAQVLAAEGIATTVVVPNIVRQVARSVRPRRPVALFVGGFDHAPNGAAVDWFQRDIWPRVRQAVPDAEWIIAGSNAPADVRALDGHDGVTVRGYVQSTAELLDAAAVSVAPLTFGGGMKGKVSEALAAGVAVVTTRWGAQGFESGLRDEAFVCADDPRDFAAAVVHLFRDEASREAMGERGRALAQRVCSVESAAPALEALVQRSADAGQPESFVRRCIRMVGVAADRGRARVRRRLGGAAGPA